MLITYFGKSGNHKLQCGIPFNKIKKERLRIMPHEIGT